MARQFVSPISDKYSLMKQAQRTVCGKFHGRAGVQQEGTARDRELGHKFVERHFLYVCCDSARRNLADKQAKKFNVVACRIENSSEKSESEGLRATTLLTNLRSAPAVVELPQAEQVDERWYRVRPRAPQRPKCE